jgi:hypothetical protein
VDLLTLFTGVVIGLSAIPIVELTRATTRYRQQRRAEKADKKFKDLTSRGTISFRPPMWILSANCARRGWVACQQCVDRDRCDVDGGKAA